MFYEFKFSYILIELRAIKLSHLVFDIDHSLELNLSSFELYVMKILIIHAF